MEWGKQMEKHGENAKLSLYQNTNYSFERRERKTIILEIDLSTGTNTFSEKLIEPLIVDKLSDIYLDSFTTHYVKTADSIVDVGFILDINQFNIKSNSNKAAYFNKVFIPNEQTTASNPALARVHKGKKLNYICSINPTKLREISGSLTLSDGSTAVAAHNDFVAIAEFIIVARDDDK